MSTPVPLDDSASSKKSLTPTNENTPTKLPLTTRSSIPKTPNREKGPSSNTVIGRSKAAMNKTGLGAKRALCRPTETASSRGKTLTSRDRPSSVKQRTSVKGGTANSTIPGSRSRRNSEIITGSLSNLSLKSSEADNSVRSDVAPRNRPSTRSVASAPSPSKRVPKVTAKVDCHRTPIKKTPASSTSGDIVTKKDKEGVKSRISSIMNRPSTKSMSRKASDASLTSAPTTPRAARSQKSVSF